MSSNAFRREICPENIRVGQIALIKIKFRLLGQDYGTSAFRLLLKGAKTRNHHGTLLGLAGQVVGHAACRRYYLSKYS